MGCGNFFIMLVALSVALITYNILISANVPLMLDLPGPSNSSPPSKISVDPVIEMPIERSSRRFGGQQQQRKRMFHTAVTASDSVYNTWQCRVMYYWFRKHRDVLNRPWAFVQWLQQAEIKEDYILMAEPDHIIVKPIPNLSRDGLGAAFPFFYIEPKKYESTLRKFFPESLKKIASTWMNVSLAMKKDPEADKAFGWVLEMYAYAVSSALHGVGNILYKDFMIQPPWDTELGEKFIIHYTYGCDYNMKVSLYLSPLVAL
ncbi:hypothetical protein CRG98_011967 [Punica granatum]|uniref:Hydroxyproline O-arabinosyltransferase-like domain-containing protein n=1 Tax=Punica granatum TaxID=22663 RepID=A0A2I0KGY8_PUNGR|nr:hypothetical protein CRG98_011967 [Punica granatum]